MKRLVLIVLVQFLFLTFLVAQTYKWTGIIDQDVTNVANWNTIWSADFSVPLIYDLVIPAGTPNDPYFITGCNVGGTTASGSITIDYGASAIFTSLIIGYSGSGTVTNNGNMLIVSTLKVGNLTGGIGTFNNNATVSVGNTTTIGGNAEGTFVNSNNGSFTSKNTIINSTGTLTINSTAKGTITSTLTNNGTIQLNSTSSGIFSLMFNAYSGTGIVNTQLFLSGGGNPNYNWHYIAVPYTDGYGINDFIIVSKNLLGYDERKVTTNEFQGWLWYDGATDNGVTAGTPFSLLDFGKGYNFYAASGFNSTLTGYTLGSTLDKVNTSYTGSSVNITQYGYNLLGNSLTCSIDWNYVTPSPGVSSTVYYTTGNKWISYNSGSGGANGNGRYIPPLQGFFVKANATGASVIFGANVKVHSTQARYKKGLDSQEETKGDIIYPKVKLELTGDNTSDETIVWFNENATTGYDEKYDGFKLFPSDASVGQLYSILNGQQFVINGIPLPSSTLTVPLGIIIPQSGSYSLDKKVLEELDNYNAYLVDKTNGNYTVDIKKVDSYKFSSDAGTYTDRFVLKFESLLTTVEMPSIINKKFNIYGTKDFINILPSDDFGKESIVKIYDLTGRIVKQANISGFYKGSLLQIPFGGYQGIIIVEINSGSLRYKDKVFVY